MMRTATPTFVSRLHLLNYGARKAATVNSNGVFSYLKMLRTAARTEKMGRAACWCAQGARRVAVRCSGLYEEDRTKQPCRTEFFYASVKIAVGYVWYQIQDQLNQLI